MPKLYEYFGMIFYFYSLEHDPIHVHVRYNEFENKLEFIYKNGLLQDVLIKTVPGKKPLPANMQTEAKRFAKLKAAAIVKKWTEWFAKNQKPAFEKITKKI